MLRFKNDSVLINGHLLSPEMILLLYVANATRPPVDKHGNEYIVTITSGCEYVKGRKKGSLHPKCKAWDIRINDLPDPDKDGIAWQNRIKKFLPAKKYGVVKRGKKTKKGDNRHIHAELDPKE